MEESTRNYPQKSVWSIVGNIVGEHACGIGAAETRSGTHLFRPNAKVYLFGVQCYWAVLTPAKEDRIIVLANIGSHAIGLLRMFAQPT